MAGAVPVLWWFDRFDDRIGILPVAGELVRRATGCCGTTARPGGSMWW